MSAAVTPSFVPTFPPDKTGGFVLELGDDRTQLVGAGRRFEVLDDVDGEPGIGPRRSCNACRDFVQRGLWYMRYVGRSTFNSLARID